MLSLYLLTLAICAVAVVASPPVVRRNSPITLPFAKVISTTGTRSIVERDRTRYNALRAQAKTTTSQDQATNASANNTLVSYVINVGVGSPPELFNLIIDTGSSNTWVGADITHPYVPPFSSLTGETMGAVYGSGQFSGPAVKVDITIGSLQVSDQIIGSAVEAFGFNDGVDGILGIGPTGLTKGSLFPDESATIPTGNNLIPEHLFAVSFEPATSNPELNGELTFGGIDDSKFTGSITYTPITSTSPASQYWGIDQSISYGTTAILSQGSGIVDTGTSLIGLASDLFSVYQTATGGILDPATGLLTVTEEQYANLGDLTFTIGGTDFDLTPNAQIWPRSLNSAIGGESGIIYLVVINLGTPSGFDMDFINGQAFLERFYSVFDTANSQVGIATTPFTNAETN
ncbi:hypothetical protein NM688_g2454 [Phlebia brevispora]|uniref:Uncharacterized protein n=1 Tax=Phlebia brevispora TaxID=194682 RepID=A0ACC1T8X6_9APHY|nr:hypothetical protein NM688_g2454 [Phlebia brevispora]